LVIDVGFEKFILQLYEVIGMGFLHYISGDMDKIEVAGFFEQVTAVLYINL